MTSSLGDQSRLCSAAILAAFSCVATEAQVRWLEAGPARASPRAVM